MTPNGVAPSNRYKHQAFISNDHLWIAGGIDSNGCLLQDIYAYNIISNTFVECVCSPPISPICKYPSFCIDDKLYVITNANSQFEIIEIPPAQYLQSKIVVNSNKKETPILLDASTINSSRSGSVRERRVSMDANDVMRVEQPKTRSKILGFSKAATQLNSGPLSGYMPKAESTPGSRSASFSVNEVIPFNPNQEELNNTIINYVQLVNTYLSSASACELKEQIQQLGSKVQFLAAAGSPSNLIKIEARANFPQYSVAKESVTFTFSLIT